MDKTIENKLFAEFQNGAAAMCLKYIKRVIVRKKEKLDEWESKYYSAFPAEVAERTDSFDDIAWPENITGQYRIAQEISDNLDNSKDDSQRERYVIEMLSVFEEWGNIFSPVARLKELDKMLKYGCTINSEEEIKQEIERVSNLHDYYLDIMRDAEKGTMEYYLDVWHGAYHKFSKMLAAICAEHHINLLELQDKRGIWIIEKLDVLDLQCYFGYFGSLTYANNLLKELPRTASTENLILTERNGAIDSEAAWKIKDTPAALSPQPKPKKVGRKVESFRDYLLVDEDKKDALLIELHKLIEGQRGKSVALVIYACVDMGWLRKPTFSQVKDEFGDIGSDTGYNNYVNSPQRFSDAEINGIKANLRR